MSALRNCLEKNCKDGDFQFELFFQERVDDNEDPQCADWDRFIYCQDNEDFDDKETSYEDSDETKGAPNFMLTGRR